MKRIALAPLILAAVTLRWLNGKPDPRAAHRTIVAVVAAVALIAILSPAPAAADHGHNCVYSGGAWVGQGLCPGMPGFVPHTATPTAEPPPTSTQAPAPTTPPVTPSPTSTAPSPTSTAPAPTATTPAPTSTSTPTSTPTSTRTGCLRSYGNEWCTGATPSSTTTPAAVVTGPLVETDRPLYAPAVFPARILR